MDKFEKAKGRKIPSIDTLRKTFNLDMCKQFIYEEV